MTNIEVNAARATIIIAANTERIANALERLLKMAKRSEGEERRERRERGGKEA